MAKPRPDEQKVISALLSYADDPVSFVMFAFPWGKPNSPLQGMSGPRDWQMRALKQIRDHVIQNKQRKVQGLDPELLRLARSSGRGIGKSAFLAWIALWMFCCHPASTTIVAANTEQQLKSTTFPEIKKWASMSIMNTWFDTQAMSIRPAQWLVSALRDTTDLDDAYWYIQARLWSEESPDAFAGLHSNVGMAVLFDEASGIPAPIWSVTAGFFTDKTLYRVWAVISNPRSPTGPFFECFNRDRNLWQTESIDARSVEENDQALYQSIIEQYGADSDEARVEVYGQFPRQGDQQFIGSGLVTEARERPSASDPNAPLLLGVDPARYGDDDAVLLFRKGNDITTYPIQRYKKCSLEELADHIVAAANAHEPDAIFVEGDGVGGGLVDILKRRRLNVHEVTMGGRADQTDKFSNRRTELWSRMRDWLMNASIPNDDRLATDLSAPEFSYTIKGQIRLEPKDKMKKRGYASPDSADALAVTFAKQVARKGPVRRQISRMARDVDYNLFA